MNVLAQILDFKHEYTGLSDEKVSEHIKLYGYNSDTRLDEKDKGYNPVKAFFNVRFGLLIAAAILSFLNGDIVTGIILAVLGVLFSVTEIIKNNRNDAYFFELKRRAKSEYRVVRNGEITLIKREHLVPDDIMILSEGESVPADAHLLEIKNLTVDESVFTGSKTPVSKFTGSDSNKEELKKSCVYKGTKVVSGELIARITATGVDTRYFMSYGAPKETDEYYTSIEKIVIRVSNIFTAVSAVMLVFAALFHFTPIDITHENPVLNTIYNTVYPAIAFALCFVPATAASIVRAYYIKGAQKLQKKNASVKNLKSIEHLNAVTCICIDKSGTVTKNHTEVVDELTANSAMLTNIAVLACEKDIKDAFDKAIILNATFKGADAKELHENELLKVYPFDENIGAAGNLWDVNGTRLLCIKGSPEKLLPLCDVDNDMLYAVQNKLISYGKQGYNVLVVAFSQLSEEDDIPESISAAHFSFMGLLAFDNPTRDYIPAAVRNCYRSGVRVVMLTGDSPEVAGAVAAKIGIREEGAVTAEEFLTEETDASAIGAVARVTSADRQQIIKKLQDSGEIVTVMGESASDGDLLELSDVGITISDNITGAAFEASDVIIKSGGFESVVDVIRTARQIHTNVKRSISTVLVGLITVILFAAINLFLGSPFILSPIIVTLITTLIIPAAAYMFIENTADMKAGMEPSRYIGKGLLRKTYFIRPILQGLGLAAAEIMFYLISSGYGTADAETIAKLTAQSSSNFFIIFVFGLVISSWISLSEKSIFTALRSGQAFAGAVSGILIALALVLVFVPFVNTALGLASVDIMMLIIAFIVTLVLQLPAELIKLSRK